MYHLIHNGNQDPRHDPRYRESDRNMEHPLSPERDSFPESELLSTSHESQDRDEHHDRTPQSIHQDIVEPCNRPLGDGPKHCASQSINHLTDQPASTRKGGGKQPVVQTVPGNGGMKRLNGHIAFFGKWPNLSTRWSLNQEACL
ncbi:MAG: hypothetical protein IPJ85_04105 [Flavobacteriales bacterium]|nr:hypothetical protein [Flavobacteriales bacterium]